MKVALHEIKASLTRCIARARAGEVIEITFHEQPVARIVGIAAGEASGIARLLASGAAQWRGGKPALGPAVRLVCGGQSLSEVLIRDRG